MALFKDLAEKKKRMDAHGWNSLLFLSIWYMMRSIFDAVATAALEVPLFTFTRWWNCESLLCGAYLTCVWAASTSIWRTSLSPFLVILPWCVTSAEFLTDGANPKYATSDAKSGNLFTLSIAEESTSAVYSPTPRIVLSSCAS